MSLAALLACPSSYIGRRGRRRRTKAKDIIYCMGKFLQCVHTACILRTQRLGYSPN